MSTTEPDQIVRRRRRSGPAISAAKRWTVVLVVAGVVVGLDQLSKWWALDRLNPATGGATIDAFWTLRFNLAFNTGMAFSKGTDSGRWIGLVALVIVVVLLVVARRVRSMLQLVLIAIVIGGALGNVVDRIARADNGFMTGGVVDFVDLQWYPVFNLADACIVVGGISLALVGLGSRDDEGDGRGSRRKARKAVANDETERSTGDPT